MASLRSLWRAEIYLTVLFFAVAGFIWFVVLASQPKERSEHAGPDERTLNRSVPLKNYSIAALENGRFDEALPMLLELATSGLGEPVGPRDYAIARLLALQKMNEPPTSRAYRDAFDLVESSVSLASKLEPNQPTPHLLHAKVAFLRGESQRGIAHLRTAAMMAAIDPVLWHMCFLSTRDAGKDSLRRDGEEALKTAAKLVPGNLHVLCEGLEAQARNQESSLVPALDRASELLRPFLSDAERGPKQALPHAIAEAKAAAQAGNWPAAAQEVAKAVKAAAALAVVQADKRRVERDLSWYALTDFSETFYQQRGIPRLLPKQSVPVQFHESNAAGALASLNDVRAARWVDLNADGKLDVAVLRTASLEIYRRDGSGGDWGRAFETALPSGRFEHFLPIRLGPEDAQDSASLPPTDFLLYGPDGVLVLRGELKADGKSPSFEVVRGRELAEKTKGAESVAAIDLDQDGALDLVVSRSQGSDESSGGISLWRNRGHHQFEEITSRSWPANAAPRGKSLNAVDWDQDLDVDVILVGHAVSKPDGSKPDGSKPDGSKTDGSKGAGAQGSGDRVAMLKGHGEGRFDFHPIEVQNPAFEGATAITVLDADSNGSWDLLTTGPRGMALVRTISLQAAHLSPLAIDTVSDFPAEELFVLDYDNDGSPDVLAWNRDAVRLFHGRAEGRFESAEGVMPAEIKSIASADGGDFDADGDTDLLVVSHGDDGNHVHVLQNDGGNANHWIDVALGRVAPPTQSSPAQSSPAQSSPAQFSPTKVSLSDSATATSLPEKGVAEKSSVEPRPIVGPTAPLGFGSMLQLKTGAVCQSQLVTQPVTHFGLGSADAAQVLRIVWPAGVPFNIPHVVKNQPVFERPAALPKKGD